MAIEFRTFRLTVNQDIDPIVVHHDAGTDNVVSASFWQVYDDGKEAMVLAGLTILGPKSVKIQFGPTGFTPNYRVVLGFEVN